jgi:hypothetical protein
MNNMDANLKQAVASLMKDPSQRQAFAEMIVEYVQPNHVVPDFVSILLNTRSLQPGDSLVKKLRKGIKVRTLVPGAIHLANEITVKDRINYVLDGADVKVTWNEWELDNGEIGTVESMRAEMLAKLRDYYQNKVFTALSTVWSAVNTPSNYTNVGGAITATALENAIDHINNTTGGVKAVVGVRSVMTPISKFGAFWNDGGTVGTDAQWAGVDSQLEQVMREGRLGTYYGAPLIMINQVWDNPEDYNTLLPTDKILVIGENVGEFITYGTSKEKQYSDPRPTPPQWFLEIYQQFGLMVWNAQGIYVLGGLS